MGKHRWLSHGATFSFCRRWRYTLWRQWDPGSEKDYCAFIGLNPSTADEVQNDPTVTRCINFAKAWGFPGMWMLNLFALRSTDPKGLYAAVNPYGPHENWKIIWDIAQDNCAQVVVCWGAHGAYQRAGHTLLTMLDPQWAGCTPGCGKQLKCFGKTKSRQPKHPLYLANATPLLDWETAWHS